MDDLNQIIETISLTMGAAWGSGINLYATILVLGFLGATDNIVLPQSLEILMNPLVIGAAGLMYVVEFIADKIPGVDTGWDTLHTFVRIPAGVLLAAGAVGDVNPAVAVAAGILGGGLSASTHAAKSGTRLLINTSPEPVSNWTASVLEDVAVITGVWAALAHPWVFLVILILFILLMIWFLPKLWNAIKKFFAFLGRIFGGGKKHSDAKPDKSDDPIIKE
ncbi:MAG: DUF4126 domain-containing protein [Desulfobacterales bacterium]|nr:DUF4126 domain-containing protein [Desulfobacterales bacterium]